MTKGPIVKTILRLALPIMASSMLGTLYNICDMAWVGTLGAKAVAGVGVGGMYIWLASGIATLPRMGGQVLTAQSLGAGKREKAQAYARAAIQMTVLFALLIGVSAQLLTRQMVSFFTLQDPVSEGIAVSYLRITCGLILFNHLNFTLTGLFTAEGDSKTPMVASFFGVALNMLLDPMLITGIGFFPRMEAVGAAVATVISQMVVTVILLIRMRSTRSKTVIFRGQSFLSGCDKEIYGRIFRIGAPAAVQSALYCFISMVVTRFVSAFGAEAVAVARVGGQIESVSWNTAEGFSSAINSFCGQNYGAGEYDRIRKGYRFSVITAFLWGVMVLTAFVLFPRVISDVFFHEEIAVSISISYLTIIGLSEPFLMAEIVTVGALSGLGRTKLCSIISGLCTGLRIPLAYFLQRTALGLNGIWWTFAITSMLMGVIITIAFVRTRIEQKPHKTIQPE